ncbi:MAG: TM1812 family CRISPR-associated protein [Gemmatimonadetes bacterium]|jgi:CRISPR-associated DxTHG motif protein|nr:TM1812 family CRISPR-associated protein [Gemmatimonadota bacterium]
MKDAPHILLTSLGAGPLREPLPRYTLAGRESEAPFAPLALWHLLPQKHRPDRMLVLVTKKAAGTNFGPFQKEVERIGIPVERCDVPDVVTVTELDDFLGPTAERLPHGSRVTLDVTHGFRHHAFLFYSLALYLKSLRGVRIEGAWYGMLESGEPAKPIVNLQPALDLAEWFHAVRLFQERGAAGPIAGQVRLASTRLRTMAKGQEHETAERTHSEADRLLKLWHELRQFSFAYESGLPLELGKAAREVVDTLSAATLGDAPAVAPLAEELAGQIRAAAMPVALSAAPSEGKTWKSSVVLTDEELARQREVIEQYLKRDQLPLALGLMREWVVSWVIFSRGEEEATRWLERPVRQRAERRLGALRGLVDRKRTAYLNSAEKWWGSFWKKLADLRNDFLHQGMSGSTVDQPTQRLTALRKNWDFLATASAPALGGGRGRLLITPQGKSKGVLFNALRAHGLEVDRCLVICSEESRPTLEEAAAQAGFGGELLPLVMADPHTGAGEIERMVHDAELVLLEADDIVANLTGGTTLMGVVVQELVERARRLDRSWRRFLLIDRRPPKEQENHPWVECEIHWRDQIKENADDED